jgi:hypothetical protein
VGLEISLARSQASCKIYCMRGYRTEIQYMLLYGSVLDWFAHILVLGGLVTSSK